MRLHATGRQTPLTVDRILQAEERTVDRILQAEGRTDDLHHGREKSRWVVEMGHEVRMGLVCLDDLMVHNHLPSRTQQYNTCLPYHAQDHQVASAAAGGCEMVLPARKTLSHQHQNKPFQKGVDHP
jgi:hypothetical protein